MGTFSGGMKRRVNIGVGLLHKPRIIYMDEPTVGIDPQSRRSILDAVKELNRQGMTVLYTTHYMEEAAELSDRVGIIDHGKLIALGTQKELTEMVGEHETLRLHLDEDQSGAALAEALQTLPGVIKASAVDHQVVLIVPRGRGGAGARHHPGQRARRQDSLRRHRGAEPGGRLPAPDRAAPCVTSRRITMRDNYGTTTAWKDLLI